ncbi:MAG TPA: DNA primase [Vicinamibacterales bacterium]|nr:DNA primase [Vicinamibacterales bacterium]
MALFPQSFIDDLRLQTDIVQVIQEYVPLKRSGATYKGLCPFHGEKTPSFHVNREKGFFHCFGCGVGGDVFKFLELHEKLSFPEAARQLAQRFGVPIPETPGGPDDRVDTAEREALLKAHETAAAYFREQLGTPAGARARQELQARGLTPATMEALGFGYAPASRDGLKSRLLQQGLPLATLVRSGLVVQRDNGDTIDRFRHRLMIPICRDTGPVIAFGGRALDADQVPKYLNSPETPIYSKGRTLYGLELTKAGIRRLGYAVLVEGYFDFAQVFQGQAAPVVAACGTALTSQQASLLRRFTSKVVLSYDPDAAGQGAAARSCELLVAEGFDVNVALLESGDDPDAFIRKLGVEAYRARLRNSRPYLEFLLDRAGAEHDLTGDEGRRRFLGRMLEVAARIPDPAARDQFGDRLAHKARITEEVVRTEIRKAAVSRRTTLTLRELPGSGQLKQAERGLIWGIFHETSETIAAVKLLEDKDLENLVGREVFEVAQSLQEEADEQVPAQLLRRLSTVSAALVTGVAADAISPAPPAACVRTLKRLRYERERAAIQREIDRLQELGATAHGPDIDRLWQEKLDLLHRIEALASEA